MQVRASAEAALLRQRGHLFPWVPVCLAIGIGGYFTWPAEPGFAPITATLAMIASAFWVGRRAAAAWSPLIWALALTGCGFVLGAARAHWVAAPVLEFRYYGPVEGRLIGLDRSASDALRLTLDRVRLRGVAPGQTPDRVRVSLHGGELLAAPGQRVMTTAHLSPPQGPVEPGGFDFRRHAWFKGLGAVGYSRVPVLVAATPERAGPGVRIFRLRSAASDRIRQILPGDVGGLAAAITTGDRSGIGAAALTALRASNLAHLLAISGLHMGLLGGFVFVALRVALSLAPALALRVNVRKIAAVGAWVAATFYLALSGGNVATERAYVMIAVMFGAVLLDRKALSLRAIAVAAVVVLALRPESLLSPGFQMSFAATTALVAVFGAIRDAEIRPGTGWGRAALGLLVSSSVAGAATAPVAAAHFNALAHYGLAANLVTVPLMGALVIPAAVLAACLAPLGLDWIGLELMGLGLSWVLGVAHWVAGLDGARGYVPSPPDAVLPLLALGSLVAILWRGPARWGGLVPVAAAALMWTQAERPVFLVAETGTLVGVMTDHGRALSKPRGAGFVAGVWLENDGDGATQEAAAARLPEAVDGVWRQQLAELQLVHVLGKRGLAALDGCRDGQVVVSSVKLTLGGGCETFDAERLRHTGAVALMPSGEWRYARRGAARLWHGPGR